MELSPEQKAAVEEQKQYCPFCKIVKGEIPASKIYDDSTCIVILDINPATPGHAILVPKEHYPVMPFLPDKERNAFATLLPQLGAALEKTMLATGYECFVANGAAAGQQTSHFLIHLFPADKSRFALKHEEHERGKALRAALSARYGDPKEKLGQLLSSNPGLRQLIVERPNDFKAQLASAPDVAALFKGVDIPSLAKQLTETETPRAMHMEDEAFLAFLDSKEKLRTLLQDDHETLAAAIEAQPKLKQFFDGATIPVVAARYKALRPGDS